MRFSLIHFTSEIYRSPTTQSLLNLFGEHCNVFTVFPSLIAGEIESQIEDQIQLTQDRTEDPLLFVGMTHSAFTTNAFANRFLSPRILIEPVFGENESKSDFVVSHGVPGIIIHSKLFGKNHAPGLFSSMFQMNQVNDESVFDFSKGSTAYSVINEFIYDLERFAI